MASKRNGRDTNGTVHKDATTGRYISELARKFGKYSHTPEAIREAVDKSMGDKRLSDLLYEDRGKR